VGPGAKGRGARAWGSGVGLGRGARALGSGVGLGRGLGTPGGLGPRGHWGPRGTGASGHWGLGALGAWAADARAGGTQRRTASPSHRRSVPSPVPAGRVLA
jgi:hypothetical protein